MSQRNHTLSAAVICSAVFVMFWPTPGVAGSDGWGGSATTVGSGNLVIQARQISDFQALKVSGSIDVRVRQTGRESVEVKADDNLLPLIETTVETEGQVRTLHVRWKRGVNVRTKNDPVVNVEVARLTAVAISGSGDVAIDGLKTPSLALSLSGSGDARLAAVDVETMDITISGSGDVQAAGKATRLKIGVAGSGDVKANELKADEVMVSIAGSGDVAVHADKSLSVSIAGSGDVSYGGAAMVKSSVAGSGSVTRRK